MRALCGLLLASAVLVLAGCSSAPTTPSSPAAVPQPAARLTLDQANDVTVMAIGLVARPIATAATHPLAGLIAAA